MWLKLATETTREVFDSHQQLIDAIIRGHKKPNSNASMVMWPRRLEQASMQTSMSDLKIKERVTYCSLVL